VEQDDSIRSPCCEALVYGVLRLAGRDGVEHQSHVVLGENSLAPRDELREEVIGGQNFGIACHDEAYCPCARSGERASTVARGPTQFFGGVEDSATGRLGDRPLSGICEGDGALGDARTLCDIADRGSAALDHQVTSFAACAGRILAQTGLISHYQTGLSGACQHLDFARGDRAQILTVEATVITRRTLLRSTALVAASAPAAPALAAPTKGPAAGRLTNLSHLRFLLDDVPLPAQGAHSSFVGASQGFAPWTYADRHADGTFSPVGGGDLDSATGYWSQGA